LPYSLIRSELMPSLRPHRYRMRVKAMAISGIIAQRKAVVRFI
jgi:hypothetical protein